MAAVREVLSWLPSKVLAEVPHSPRYVVHSLAEQEARIVGQEAIDDVLTQGAASISVMGDIMTAVAVILMLEPVSLNSVSVGNLIRSQLESSVRASWLLDPSISPKIRVARSLVLEFDGLRAAHDFASQFGDYFRDSEQSKKPQAAMPLSQRWGVVEKSAERLQLPLDPGEGGIFRRVQSVDGVSLPRSTELTRQETGTTVPYSLLSKVDHINPVAMLGVERVLGMRQVVLAFLPKIFQWFVAPIWRYFTLCRLDVDRLKAILDEAWQAATLPVADRSWEHFPARAAKGPVFG